MKLRINNPAADQQQQQSEICATTSRSQGAPSLSPPGRAPVSFSTPHRRFARRLSAGNSEDRACKHGDDQRCKQNRAGSARTMSESGASIVA